MELLTKALGTLTKREKEVIDLIYDLNQTGKKYTHREAGEKLGISSARVNQLKGRATRRLNAFFKDLQ